MKFTYLFTTLVLLLTVSNSDAQIPVKPKNIQSPNASSLGTFGEIPVSKFSGMPSIGIPIYGLNQDNISVPISLGYHASGFRPDQHPGWVGMGWNLTAAGAIIRQVNDIPDDYPCNRYTGDIPPTCQTGSQPEPTLSGEVQGFYFSYMNLDNSNWNYKNTVLAASQFSIDTEPDEFTFSFPGGSGKFYLDHQRNWKVKCDKPVKVSFHGTFIRPPNDIIAPHRYETSGNENFKSFSGFTITDEWGTQFVFGGETSAIEYGINFFSQDKDQWVAQAWYLKKIISVTGHEVDFTYERDSYVNQLYTSLYNKISAKVSVNNSWVSDNCSATEYFPNGILNEGVLISPVYLSKIETVNCKVSFVRSVTTELRYKDLDYETQMDLWITKENYGLWNYTGATFLPILSKSKPPSCSATGCVSNINCCLDQLQWKKLDEIIIYEKIPGTTNTERVKSFSFNYSNDINQRLTLLSVQENGNDNSVLPPYTFSYDNSKTLPVYLSGQTDHWGFFNGKTPDLSNPNTYYNTYYNDKEPDVAFLLAGSLNKITYPTRGVTEFTFEPNVYSKRVAVDRGQGIDPGFSANTSAGGLRIRKIVSYDPDKLTPKVSKEYYYSVNYKNATYVANDLSSGVLSSQSKYYFNDYEAEKKEANGTMVKVRLSIFSSQSVLPVSSNDRGTHVGYSEVIEKNEDGGYTKYYYTNFDNGRLDETGMGSIQTTRTEYEPHSSCEEERGLLWKQETYNSSDVLLSKNEFTFSAINKSTDFVRAIKTRHMIPCTGNLQFAYEGNAYKIFTYSYLPIKEVETVYNQKGQNPIIAEKNYEYDSQTKLIKMTTSSDGLSPMSYKNTRYTYCYEYPSTGASLANQLVYREMTSKNIIANPIEVYQGRNGSTTTSIGSGVVTTFLKDPISNVIAPEKVLRLETNQLINNYSLTEILAPGYNGNVNETFHFDTRYKANEFYTKFNNRGKLLEYNGPGGKEVYLWGYDGQYLVAKIAGTTYNDVIGFVSQSILDNPGSDPSLLRNELNKIRTGLQGSKALVATYTYKPLVGILSETDPAGRTIFYEYDAFGRLSLVKDENGHILKTYNYNYKQ